MFIILELFFLLLFFIFLSCFVHYFSKKLLIDLMIDAVMVLWLCCFFMLIFNLYYQTQSEIEYNYWVNVFSFMNDFSDDVFFSFDMSVQQRSGVYYDQILNDCGSGHGFLPLVFEMSNDLRFDDLLDCTKEEGRLELTMNGFGFDFFDWWNSFWEFLGFSVPESNKKSVEELVVCQPLPSESNKKSVEELVVCQPVETSVAVQEEYASYMKMKLRWSNLLKDRVFPVKMTEDALYSLNQMNPFDRWGMISAPNTVMTPYQEELFNAMMPQIFKDVLNSST